MRWQQNPDGWLQSLFLTIKYVPLCERDILRNMLISILLNFLSFIPLNMTQLLFQKSNIYTAVESLQSAFSFESHSWPCSGQCRFHYHQSHRTDKEREVCEITGLKVPWLDSVKMGNLNESSIAKCSTLFTEPGCCYQIKLPMSDIPDFISLGFHRKAFLESRFRFLL